MKGESRPRIELWEGESPFSITDLLAGLGTGRIPVLEPFPADERLGCAYALSGDHAGAATCPNRASEPCGLVYCALNGDWQDPCLFDEPENAPVWREIRAGRGQ
jgi:hypothetical protein